MFHFINLFFRKTFIYLFAFSVFFACSKKDLENNKVKRANDVVVNNIVKSDINKTLNLAQNNKENINSTNNIVLISEEDPIYKTPIFIEIPRDALSKKGDDFSSDWKNFLQKYKPFGVILHKYHCQSKKKLSSLIKKIKELGGQDTIIAVDREGGRVDRLFWGNYEQWRHYPSPEEMGTLYEQSIKISELPSDNKIKKAVQPDIKQLEKDFERIFDKMFQEMKQVGIDMTFAPNCDIKSNNSDKFTIGTRAYSENANTVSKIAKIFVKSAIKNNILIAPKHAPGLGSVVKDTHFEYAIIDKTKKQIEALDMKPFIDIFKAYKNDVHFILCPHVLYKDIDAQNISTKSQKFTDYIRENTKSDLLIISDDLSMNGFENSSDSFEKSIIQVKSDILITGIGRSLKEVIQVAETVKKKNNTRFFKFLHQRNLKNNQ